MYVYNVAQPHLPLLKRRIVHLLSPKPAQSKKKKKPNKKNKKTKKKTEKQKEQKQKFV